MFNLASLASFALLAFLIAISTLASLCAWAMVSFMVDWGVTPQSFSSSRVTSVLGQDGAGGSAASSTLISTGFVGLGASGTV